MKEGYAVIVCHMGQSILTIESSMYSGKSELSEEDKDAIRAAGQQLIAFAGPEHTQCFACGSWNECEDDCPIAAGGIAG